MPAPASGSSEQPDTTGGQVTLNQAEAARRCAVHDHLVVLISDLDGADDETKRPATLLAAHNDVLVIAVYDPLGASLQGGPGMVAADRGATYTLPAGTTFAASFQRAFAAVLDRWTDIFQALRVPVLPISAAEQPAEQLRALFGQHLAAR